jgi:DNA-binding transcriptional LysR family regulator
MGTLQNMRTFMCVAEAGSLTAASKHMRLTVPTISRNIAKLETHLSTRLINRNTRHMALTEAGLRYLEWCQRIISTVDQAEIEARSAVSLPEGRLRLHAMVGVGRYFVVPAVAEFRKLHPAVSFELTMSNRIPDLLEEGIDIAIIAADRLPDSGYVSRHLGDTQSILCASAAYLAQKGTPLVPGDIVQHDCLQLGGPTTAFKQWRFTRNGQEQVVEPGASFFELDSAEAMIQALESGMGIGLLPAFAAEQRIAQGGLVQVLPDYELPGLSIYAIYAARLYLDAKIKAFIRTLDDLVP